MGRRQRLDKRRRTERRRCRVNAEKRCAKSVVYPTDAGTHTTYNFEVEDFHTYFVGDSALWVHNMCGGDATKGGDETVDVFRVFGGDARAQGFSFTTVDPRTVKNFRDGAGLPSDGASGATNSADFLIKGTANTEDIIKSRSALPLDGNKGGLPELIIDPKNVEITDFSVIKP